MAACAPSCWAGRGLRGLRRDLPVVGGANAIISRRAARPPLRGARPGSTARVLAATEGGSPAAPRNPVAEKKPKKEPLGQRALTALLNTTNIPCGCVTPPKLALLRVSVKSTAAKKVPGYHRGIGIFLIDHWRRSYIAEPRTLLHGVDARVKQVGVFSPGGSLH